MATFCLHCRCPINQISNFKFKQYCKKCRDSMCSKQEIRLKDKQQAKIVRSRRYNRVMLEIGGTGDDHLTPLQGH